MPTLLLIRGPSGSGKSTHAQELLRREPHWLHLENDQFMTDAQGAYRYTPERHTQARARCLEATRRALAEGRDVAVSNTFATHAELAPYLALPAQVRVVEMYGDHPNVHGVPPAVVAEQKRAFEPYRGAERIGGLKPPAVPNRRDPGPIRTLVINPIGEPGAGKTTFAHWLTYRLKLAGVNAEYVPEAIKADFLSPKGRERVASGRFDARTLLRQHTMIQPLLGHVEVVVNDGALPVFPFYWARRLPAARVQALRQTLERCLAEQAAATHEFVLLERQHPYDSVGRFEENESRGLRQGLLDYLRTDWGIVPQPLGPAPDGWEAYVAHVVQALRPSRASRPRA